MNYKGSLKYSQEQGVASWITYLNQLRLDELLDSLSKQDINLKSALKELQNLKHSIANEVIDRNRGGIKGMHGFIGERMQVSLENAKRLIDGLDRQYSLLDNNGPDDYLFNGMPIQQKCVQSQYGINAIKEHLRKYPDFLERGGKYQIPNDYYEKLKEIWSVSKDRAGYLSKSDRKLWDNMHELFDKTSMTIDDIEAMGVDYSDIQKGTYDKTINNEKNRIREKDKINREGIYNRSKPTIKQAAQVAAVGAGIEGGFAFCQCIVEKRKNGKKLSDFNSDDWGEIVKKTSGETIKGGIRGGGVYAMSNFTATPANVASALITACYGTIGQAIKYSKGEISQEDFIINSEACCMDVGISAICAVMGEVLIPIPILGAVIGNSVGMFLYTITKKYCSNQAQKVVENYYQSIRNLEKTLDVKYKSFVEQLQREFNRYKSIVEFAFDENINIAFSNSIELAILVGVDEKKILKTKDDIDKFFCD